MASLANAILVLRDSDNTGKSDGSTDGELPKLDWRSWLALALFMAATVFVIRPVSIPVPVPAVRPLGWRKGHVHLDMKLAPWIAILILVASTAIHVQTEVVRGFVGSDGISPYSIVILIFALAYICISLDQSGVLSYIAMHVTRRWGSNGRQLLLCFYVLSTVMAVLTSNDVVVLCLTPIICVFSDVTRVDGEPFLVAMFVAANTASMALYIGNPTNIIAAQANGISFLQYSAWMALPFVGAAAAGAGVMYLVSMRMIPRDIEVDIGIRPRDMLKRPGQAVVGCVVLGACLVTLSVSSFFGVAVWIVTLPFGVAMLVVDAIVDLYSTRTSNAQPNIRMSVQSACTVSVSKEQPSDIQSVERPIDIELIGHSQDIQSAEQQKLRWHRRVQRLATQRLPTVAAVAQRLPYGIVPFALGMFIIVESLSSLGWTPRLAWVLRRISPSVACAVFTVAVVSTLACNVLNNLPMTILFTRALKHSEFSAYVDARTRKGALFALIVGSNLGANLTLVGSLAGLMFQGIAGQRQRNIGYFRFMRWCLPVLPVQLAVCCAILTAEMLIIK
ncbi:hypothetical protein LPJ53_001020 [Coemansia erecta]|uniref:Citrate transporter-like domain-containing protein n=1 Tax=Coemansia erecta TaxID=147472 RepID=A0A9W8CVC3_9FUNG|nr:hypothetical protein LPJ53_001020 [Coemansia erecta]